MYDFINKTLGEYKMPETLWENLIKPSPWRIAIKKAPEYGWKWNGTRWVKVRVV